MAFQGSDQRISRFALLADALEDIGCTDNLPGPSSAETIPLWRRWFSE
jgi:hypothetical protein